MNAFSEHALAVCSCATLTVKVNISSTSYCTRQKVKRPNRANIVCFCLPVCVCVCVWGYAVLKCYWQNGSTPALVTFIVPLTGGRGNIYLQALCYYLLLSAGLLAVERIKPHANINPTVGNQHVRISSTILAARHKHVYISLLV